VLQCVSMCCSCIAVVLQSVAGHGVITRRSLLLCCSVLQRITVSCSVVAWCVSHCHSLQHTTTHCNTLQQINCSIPTAQRREVGGWGRDPKQCTGRGGRLGSSTIFKNLMSPTPHRKWYLTTGRRAHSMVLDPIPQPLPVHCFGCRPQPPTSRNATPDAGYELQ